MQAFVEVTAGVIRFGIGANEMGDPYVVSCSFASVDGRTAVLKGWPECDPAQVTPATHAHRRAAEAALARYGLVPDWQRSRAGRQRPLTARGRPA